MLSPSFVLSVSFILRLHSVYKICDVLCLERGDVGDGFLYCGDRNPLKAPAKREHIDDPELLAFFLLWFRFREKIFHVYCAVPVEDAVSCGVRAYIRILWI